ncbi:MAG: ATP-binding protein [Acidobacteria bacterium]|nr:ATP-binding protein [Acidobacteriota bacterium]
MHRKLDEQLERLGIDPRGLPENLRKLLQQVDAAYREIDQVLDLNPSFIFAKDREGRFTLVNQAVAEAYGTTVESLLGKADADFNPKAEEVEHFRRDDLEVMDTHREKFIPLESITDAGGRLRWLQTIKRPIVDPDGQVHQILGVSTDVTLRKQAEDSLQRRNEQILAHQQALHELTLTCLPDLDAALARIAEVASRTLKVARVGIYLTTEDRTALRCQGIHQNGAVPTGKGTLLQARQYPAYFSALEEQRVIAACDACTDPRTRELAEERLRAQGITSLLHVCIRLHGRVAGVVCHEQVGPPREWALEEQHFASSIADLAALALGNAARQELEDQLRQSQKIEAVGVLAGGIAHDFNNLLTAILGYCDLLRPRLPLSDQGRAHLEEIRKAGDRAAVLTRQLLAFSRKQVLDPKVLDLNSVVSGMEGLLRRLLSEEVELKSVMREGLWHVRADPGQMEMVLMNLVANARDAMPTGGKLTLETMNLELDEAYNRRRPYAPPGQYVLLAVSDSGSGMDPETVSRVFEPFFTTKEKGRGTGLGLSTVYGVVKQSNGHIQVYSERGIGTTIKVYLPALDGPVEVLPRNPAESAARVIRGETLLLIEDETLVRELAHEILTGQGYQVLDAGSGEEAIRIFEAHAEPIHLVVTDVIMPGMNGREVYERMAQLRPGLKVLYMSGYTQSAIVHRGVLEPGTAFVQKPFTIPSFLERVREVLEASRT